MAIRIERIWNGMFGRDAVKRKEAQDQESSGHRRQEQEKQEQKPQEENAGSRPPASREQLQKAITDFQQIGSVVFHPGQPVQSGMTAEMVDTKDGLAVRIVTAAGSTVKTMSAEEFLRLKESAAGDQGGRGKILDQKF